MLDHVYTYIRDPESIISKEARITEQDSGVLRELEPDSSYGKRQHTQMQQQQQPPQQDSFVGFPMS